MKPTAEATTAADKIECFKLDFSIVPHLIFISNSTLQTNQPRKNNPFPLPCPYAGIPDIRPPSTTKQCPFT